MMEKFQIAVATLPKSRLDIHLDIDRQRFKFCVFSEMRSRISNRFFLRS